jgi:hypothetical protein
MDGRGNRRERGADIGARGRPEDMHLALFPGATGSVTQAHIVCEGMNRTPLDRGQVRGKNQGFPAEVLLEQEKLGVELERLAVVEVDFCRDCVLKIRNQMGRCRI